MDAHSDVAPAVAEILTAVEDRTGGDRVTVDARSLPRALERARDEGRRPVIAEVKPTSPTAAGTQSADPVDLARGMVAGGAAAISVLTEPTHFGGSADALKRVRAAVDVPILRKDFVLRAEHLDVVEADAVLLIARFLENLSALVEAARDRGFEPLVEVHDREELEAALAADATLLGVNNRDLARLEVDLETFERVAPHAPDEVTLIAESGIGSPGDAERMLDAGADGLLIGSAIMGHGQEDVDVADRTRRVTHDG